MKQKLVSLNSKNPQKDKERNNIFLLLLFLLLFACVISFLVPELWGTAGDKNSLPVALHSFQEADYSKDIKDIDIPSVGIGIIDEIIRDLKLLPEEYQDRIATVQAVILSPIPTSTGIRTNTRTPAPTATATLIALPTSTGTLLATPTISPSPTITPLPTATKTIFLPQPTQNTPTNPGLHLGQTKTPKPP